MPASKHSNESETSALLVNAYIDGELDVARSLEVRQQIQDDPVLAAQSVNLIALRAVLREKVLPETVSSQFRRRIRTSIGAAERRDRQPTWVALAASIVVATLVGSGGNLPRPASKTRCEARRGRGRAHAFARGNEAVRRCFDRKTYVAAVVWREASLRYRKSPICRRQAFR